MFVRNKSDLERLCTVLVDEAKAFAGEYTCLPLCLHKSPNKSLPALAHRRVGEGQLEKTGRRRCIIP